MCYAVRPCKSKLENESKLEKEHHLQGVPLVLHKDKFAPRFAVDACHVPVLPEGQPKHLALHKRRVKGVVFKRQTSCMHRQFRTLSQHNTYAEHVSNAIR